MSNESSILESDKIDPYNPGKHTMNGCDDDVNKDYNENSINSLMRTVSQYTENSVLNGEAVERAYKDAKLLEEGKELPKLPPKFGFFAPENKDLRFTIVKKYSIVILCFWVFILSVWSIYWGSMYNRQDRLINLKILVGVEDDINLPISKALQLSTLNPEMSVSATWVFRSNLNETSVQSLIHDQKYWAAIYVTQNNVSQILIDSFENAVNISSPNNFVHATWETGRDPNTMSGLIVPTIYKFATYFQSNLQSVSYPEILSNLTTSQFGDLQNTNLLTTYPIIQYHDMIPVTPVTNGPLQIGLIYIIIITFFQVMWLTELNGMVAKRVLPAHYIMFQALTCQLTFLLISLAFTCLNRAFQIEMNNAWSGGFGVMWMFSYLCMSAVGGANNNVALILFAVFPPLMGFWMLFFVILNISATFAPIPLCPEFYRFTYAMPIKNAYELMKMALFNTSRESLGRCIGVLVAWIVLNNILLPFCIMFFATMMKRKIMKEQLAQVAKEKNK